jgi:hypothetical protein
MPFRAFSRRSTALLSEYAFHLLTDAIREATLTGAGNTFVNVSRSSGPKSVINVVMSEYASRSKALPLVWM